MQEMAENMGIDSFKKRIKEEEASFEGLLPKDTVANARFAINYFTSIGLGAITEDLREFLQQAPQLLLSKKYAELMSKAKESSSSSESSDSDSSSSDSSDEGAKKGRRRK